jgi:hypothetical protein
MHAVAELAPWYPGSFRPHLDRLQTLLLQRMDGSSHVCAHLLPP